MPEQETASGAPTVSEIGRMTGFSDGVFAIVITLLVIELQVPDHAPGELLHALIEQAPAYLAFLLSFGYVGVIWLNHHTLLRLIRGTTVGLNWINLWLLLGVVIIPFPTTVLAEAFAHGGTDRDRRVAVVLYALTAAAMSAPWLAFFAYLRRHPMLLREGVDWAFVSTQRARPVVGMALYFISGALGWFVGPVIGLVGIGVMIFFHAVTSEGIRRGRARRRRPA
ncbi:TMEM175 family protein [Verrucosispora sp. WMMA2121]|uniref:TMEM175 family protein n=1 Tax=Verrucosispora sp. WMMA2121 TaxID=3015164 RepID=UPI0022B66B05|nr:TMEM175 family protein [Verrucosispora sp. WMMA2121]MCZ7418524.1 TMEM175 family protein [Verrucosispora sp. WMMA2121]